MSSLTAAPTPDADRPRRARPRRDILAAAHILPGGSWQCPGPQELVATSRRGDEMPYLAAFNRRPSTAGLKICEAPGAVLATLQRRQQHTTPCFMTKSRIAKDLLRGAGRPVEVWAG